MIVSRPDAGPLSELSEKELDEFVVYLGVMCFSSVGAAAFSRHRRPLNTAKDYLDVGPNDRRVVALAKEYFKDLAGGKDTQTLAQKWFGKDVAVLAGEVAKRLEGSP